MGQIDEPVDGSHLNRILCPTLNLWLNLLFDASLLAEARL